MTQALLLLLAVLLIVACGAFVAAEFSLLTVDRAGVEAAAAGGDRAAAGVLAAQRTLSTQLSGAQLGITISNLVIGYIAQPAIVGIISGPLESWGLSAAAVTGVSVVVALVLATVLTMVFGELVPKNLAIAKPYETARAVQGFIRGFSRAMAWPIRWFNGTANFLLRLLDIEPQEELASARSPEELSSLVRRSAEQGTLAADTARLVERSLLFGDRNAEDVATPRVRMVTVPADDPVNAVVRAAQRSGHSRFPVVGVDLDDIVGVVHLKQVVAVPPDQRDRVSVASVMSPAVAVPGTLELDPLLEQLRSGGLQLAIVIDEYGGTDGLVTIEDLVEELVGEVLDEHDRIRADVRQTRDGGWSLSGLLRLDEVQDHTGVDLPRAESYDTLGGLIAQRLGRLPVTGDLVDVPGATISVDRMDGHRVDRATVHTVEPPPAQVEEDGS